MTRTIQVTKIKAATIDANTMTIKNHREFTAVGKLNRTKVNALLKSNETLITYEYEQEKYTLAEELFLKHAVKVTEPNEVESVENTDKAQ